jgi:hypothetical protein
VSDLAHPRTVAHYSVPEGGAHNMWVAEDVLYMGYYSAGARVLDVWIARLKDVVVKDAASTAQ